MEFASATERADTSGYEVSRVVDVSAVRPDGSVSFGSGYLITADLVLTADHVVGSANAAVVRRLTGGAAVSGVVTWRGGGDLDVAVLLLAEPVASTLRLPPRDCRRCRPRR